MSVTDEDDYPAIATTAPSPVEKRDLLGNVCFYFHFAVMIFILAGWAVPLAPVLVFYLVFIPAVAIQWQFNKNSCVLNNIESYLRYGTWRAEQNAEEGAWLMTLIKNVTGVQLKPWHIDVITYGIMGSLWFAGLSHLLWW
ncbi:MAG TPA: hypothetical protein VHL34_16750 [Rhizomicrobium sp.]|jgi:hypothetical protein|nr:hypothetical protein [Rhizomicrobium sp.]